MTATKAGARAWRRAWSAASRARRGSNEDNGGENAWRGWIMVSLSPPYQSAYAYKETEANMMTQPTPGPWRVTCGAVETANSIPIAHMDREPGNGTLPVERDENARLIAKAPEMRDALKGFLEWYAQLDEPGLVPDGLQLSARLREARALLAMVRK